MKKSTLIFVGTVCYTIFLLAIVIPLGTPNNNVQGYELQNPTLEDRVTTLEARADNLLEKHRHIKAALARYAGAQKVRYNSVEKEFKKFDEEDPLDFRNRISRLRNVLHYDNERTAYAIHEILEQLEKIDAPPKEY